MYILFIQKDLPLHCAAVLPTSAILDQLLKTNANINGLNDDRRTPLHIAAMKGTCNY